MLQAVKKAEPGDLKVESLDNNQKAIVREITVCDSGEGTSNQMDFDQKLTF